MRSVTAALCAAFGLVAGMAVAADSGNTSPQDFAYQMQVMGTGEAAAYRVTLPLAVYQKVVHADLSDLRVFNGNGEQVPFAIERPATGTVTNAATVLPLFPLPADSVTTPDALRVTIESAKGAVNVQTGGQAAPSGRVNTYLVDGRALGAPVAALRLEWPENAADFAGRVKVEASDTLSDWRSVVEAAPVANLHANAGHLIEQRVELLPSKAKFWRVSWVGAAAPFSLTSILAEPAKQSVDARHVSLSVAATPSPNQAGEYEYHLLAHVPVDRVNLDLPDINTVAEVELQSRPRSADAWHTVRQAGFYRLKSAGEELRNGPVAVAQNSDPYWRVRSDPKGGGFGRTAPGLIVEWVPHELVFVARGAGPFSVAYGSAAISASAALSLSLPKNVSITPASLSQPQALGGDSRLLPPPAPYAWKAILLWAVLIAGAALLAWMAYRLSRDVKRA